MPSKYARLTLRFAFAAVVHETACGVRSAVRIVTEATSRWAGQLQRDVGHASNEYDAERAREHMAECDACRRGLN